MGVLPLQFQLDQNAAALGLTGHEVFDISGLSDRIEPRAAVEVTATAEDGSRTTFKAVARLDSHVDVNYYRNGGILPAVLRSLLKGV
jgi:aconitate hydratase